VLAKVRSRLTYGNVVATLALFVALGGSSYAALRITGKDVRDGSLTGKDVRNNSLTGKDVKGLTSADIKNGKLLAEDFAAGQLPYLTQADADGRYLTPGAGDGRYLTATQGDGRYLQASGEIRLNAPPMMWQKTNAGSSDKQLPSIGSTSFGNTTGATSDEVLIQPTVPNALLGKPLTLVAIEACYATTTNSTLDTVFVHTTTNDTGVTAGGSPLLTDTTDRTDDACRTYTLPTPHTLAPDEDVSLGFDVDFSTNAASFTAGRATFIFQR
jgi:hypothetical protein